MKDVSDLCLTAGAQSGLSLINDELEEAPTDGRASFAVTEEAT